MRNTYTLTLIACMAISIPCPTWASDVRMNHEEPFEQDFIVTAYYSSVPKQCGYVMGDMDADIAMNGEGIRGADGTEVYAGMAAAPPTYPFGARIVLPHIGTVTVHDRGSAIQETADAHRLDLWVGTGEEGLARALAFGVQHIRAVVYPPQAAQPPEAMELPALPAPAAVLRPYLTDHATFSDCEAMLTFGGTLASKLSAAHLPVALRDAFLPPNSAILIVDAEL